MAITKEEIEAAMTAKGGYTRATLAQWGVPWPPMQGWKERLINGEPQRSIHEAPPTPRPPAARPMAAAGGLWGETSCPEPGSPEFDSTKHGLLAPPITTYRKLY